MLNLACCSLKTALLCRNHSTIHIFEHRSVDQRVDLFEAILSRVFPLVNSRLPARITRERKSNFFGSPPTLLLHRVDVSSLYPWPDVREKSAKSSGILGLTVLSQEMLYSCCVGSSILRATSTSGGISRCEMYRVLRYENVFRISAINIVITV